MQYLIHYHSLHPPSSNKQNQNYDMPTINTHTHTHTYIYIYIYIYVIGLRLHYWFRLLKPWYNYRIRYTYIYCTLQKKRIITFIILNTDTTIIIWLFYVQVYALPLCYLNIWLLHYYAMIVYVGSVLCQLVGQPTKCHIKRCLEFKNSLFGHMTFVWRLTCLLDLLFMCLHCLCCLIPIGVYCSFDSVVIFNAFDVLVLSCIFSCLASVLINVSCNVLLCCLLVECLLIYQCCTPTRIKCTVSILFD